MSRKDERVWFIHDRPMGYSLALTQINHMEGVSAIHKVIPESEYLRVVGEKDARIKELEKLINGDVLSHESCAYRELKSLLAAAEKVIEFYADDDNFHLQYAFGEFDPDDFTMLEQESTTEEERGNMAREYLQKHGVKNV